MFLIGLAMVPASTLGQPAIVAERASQIKIGLAGTGVGHITQFAFGLDGRLHASTADRGVQSFHCDASSGQLSDMKTASDISGLGIGFQQSTGQMYLSSYEGSIYRLTDDNGDGSWGGGGETRVAIVQNLPTGDHSVDNIQIVGDSLYVGIGDRTINGGTGLNTGGVIDDFGGKGRSPEAQATLSGSRLTTGRSRGSRTSTPWRAPRTRPASSPTTARRRSRRMRCPSPARTRAS